MILTTSYTIERGDDSFDIDIRYIAHGDSCDIEEITCGGKPFDTTPAEDALIADHIAVSWMEDAWDRQCDEADYRYELAQERKYFGE